MIKNLLKLALPITLLIGTILVAFSITQINGLTIISQESITYGSYTWTYYKFDVNLYIKNIESAIDGMYLDAILPDTPTLPNTPADWDILGTLIFVANTLLVYLINWIIYALNFILLAPLKLILYPFNVIMSLLGINTTADSYLDVIYILYSWQLPYIPFI